MLASEAPDSVEHDLWASGFFVSLPSKISPFSFFYFVTAEHALSRSVPYDKFGIRVNLRDGQVGICRGVSKWYTHPSDPNADVAIAPFANNNDYDLLYVPPEYFRTRQSMQNVGIGPGDEVVFPGLFTYTQGEDTRNLPIVRHGNIALIPPGQIIRDDGEKMDAFLIEARSLAGISGSPVFARRTASILWNFKNDGEMPDGLHGLTGETHLVGMIHGHWDINESDINNPHAEVDNKRGVNLGIALVIPMEKIIETLNHPELVANREKEEADYYKRFGPRGD